MQSFFESQTDSEDIISGIIPSSLVLILKLNHSCPSYDLSCKSVLLFVTKTVKNSIFLCSEMFDLLPFHQSLPYQSLSIIK